MVCFLHTKYNYDTNMSGHIDGAGFRMHELLKQLWLGTMSEKSRFWLWIYKYLSYPSHSCLSSLYQYPRIRISSQTRPVRIYVLLLFHRFRHTKKVLENLRMSGALKLRQTDICESQKDRMEHWMLEMHCLLGYIFFFLPTFPLFTSTAICTTFPKAGAEQSDGRRSPACRDGCIKTET